MSDELAALRMRIARLEARDSTWGWVVPQETPPFLAEHLGAGTLRGGRPVVYEPPE